MKPATQQRKVVRAPMKCGEIVGSSRAQRSTKKTSQKTLKSVCQEDKLTGEVHKQSLPSCSGDIMCAGFVDNGTCQSESNKRSPLLELYSDEHKILPCSKIKLQLFPIDEHIRMGLEMDGLYPYLELTLSARKKISAVLKHLNSKWGSSSIADGEPILVPYNNTGSLFGCVRWTLDNNDISAGDVYAAIGRPSIFRLRYGWLNKRTPFEVCSHTGGAQSGGSISMENLDAEGKQANVIAGNLKSVYVSEATNTVVAEKISNDLIEPVDNERLLNSGIEQSSMLFVDNLTDKSVGGLPSEASLQRKFNSFDPNLRASSAGSGQTQLISDSLNAFITAELNCSQGPQLSNRDLRSILDTEETCHAFPASNLSSSKDLDATAGSRFLDADPKSYKFPQAAENRCQAELTQENAGNESKTDRLLCSNAFVDENSLGLTGVKWCDSLGPFDLGLPAYQKLPASGDSNISISGFIR